MTQSKTSFRPIYPAKRNPYYIVAPRYVRTSAGIKSLHLLCHSLNTLGQSAYILLHPSHDHITATHPELLTPLVTQRIIDHHFRRGLTPIVVYPETVAGNPFQAPFVVRYVLNFPGHLGGDKTYPSSELIYSYSKTLADAVGFKDNVLFIPATDTNIFHPPEREGVRQGSCFFASKYKTIHNGKLLPITDGSVEIVRDVPEEQTPQQIAELFRRSEVFYAYENTALAIEAVLCGCPAVFIPNQHLSEMIAAKELGPEGYAWGTDEAEIARARSSVAAGRANYMKLYGEYWQQLDGFIASTQAHVKNIPYKAPMHILQMQVTEAVNENVSNSIGFFFTAWRVLREEGIKAFLIRAKNKILRNLKALVGFK